MANKSMTAANTEIDNGTTQMQNTALMGMNQVNNVVLGQLNIMEGNFQSAMSIIENNVAGMISSVASALAQPLYGPNIKVPHFSMSGKFDAQTNSVPTVNVSWYAKGGIFTQPTILGSIGVGEAGAEAVLPIETLKNYITEAMTENYTNTVNVDLTVNGAEDPSMWAAEFTRMLKQQMRIG